MSAILFVARDQVLPKRVVKASSQTVPILLSKIKKMSEKSVIFVRNSTINCVYHKGQKNKKSKILHAIFEVVFGNIYLVEGIFNIRGRKLRFSASIQTSLSEKSVFSHFEVNFFTL